MNNIESFFDLFINYIDINNIQEIHGSLTINKFYLEFCVEKYKKHLFFSHSKSLFDDSYLIFISSYSTENEAKSKIENCIPPLYSYRKRKSNFEVKKLIKNNFQKSIEELLIKCFY